MEQDDPMLLGRIPEQDRHVRLLLDSGLIEQCEAAFDDSIASSPNLVGEEWSRPVVLVHRAMLAWRLGRVSLALELAADAWTELDAEWRHDSSTAHALSMLGYLLEGHSTPALELLSRAVRIARDSGEPDTIAHCLLREGTTLLGRVLMHGFPDARYLHESLARFDEAISLTTHGALRRRTLASSARALVELDEIETAHERVTEALTDSRRCDDLFGEAIANWTLAEVYRRRGELEPARTTASRALHGAELSKDTLLITRISTDLGAICQQLGDHVGEATALRRALRASGDTVNVLREGLAQALEQRRIAIHAQRKASAAEATALRDPLTGLANRLGLERYAPRLIEQSASQGRIPWLLLLDVDWFKDVNDRAGHSMGDTVLREVASLLRNECRGEDLICRWAGDEFVILLVESSGDGRAAGPVVAERIRRAVDRHHWRQVLGEIERPPTVSIGAAAGPAKLEELFTAADVALYRAKHAGRNRVEVNDSDHSTPQTIE
ncbi:GGDEF domain-containing protein [Actinopolyspora mortivallis]|uniref:GGDEF domain-containing protein n=1 Tax=Actinopolyspora mortivallis TaxID=33906 RepID=UPI000369EFA2|nr:GGDEF domain-containing protein [Actinopolyspora mortivallis]